MGLVDNTPENGDESSNRQFIIIAGALAVVFIGGLIAVLAIFSSRQGARQTILDGNGTSIAQATIAAEVAAITDTPQPEATEVPSTATSSATPRPTAVSPTQTSTSGATLESASGTESALNTVQGSATAGVGAGVPGDSSAGSTRTVEPTPTATSRATSRATSQSTTTAGGSTGSSGTDLPDTGIGEVAGLMFASFLVVLIVAARRIRVSQS